MNYQQLINMQSKPSDVANVPSFNATNAQKRTKYTEKQKLHFITEVKRIGLKMASETLGIPSTNYFNFSKSLGISVKNHIQVESK